MVTLKGNHQNPLQLKPYTSKYLQRRVRADKIKVLLLRTRLFWKLYENYKKQIKYRSGQNNPLCLIVYYMVHALYMDQNILRENKMHFCLLHICIMKKLYYMIT